MKIAQIAPLIESVPPKLYGGTERVVGYLSDALVAQGHDVTLFASGESDSAAKLVPCSVKPLRLDATVQDTTPYYMLMLDKVRKMASRFDVLHFHIDQFHFPIFNDARYNTLTTLHGRQDLPDLRRLYLGFRSMPLVSISEAQRAQIPDANVIQTVYHGLPLDLLNPTMRARGGYLAFIGRISPEKRVDRAIEIANAVGLPIRIAAKVDRADVDYFVREIEPLLLRPGVEYIGEIGEHQKNAFLGDANALLFPVDWPEPFGLAMIEAMACGTPVLAFRNGSVPEIIEPGVTGEIVDSVEEAICKLGAVLALDRGRIRRRFEQRFAAERMAREYVRLYERILRNSRSTERELPTIERQEVLPSFA